MLKSIDYSSHFMFPGLSILFCPVFKYNQTTKNYFKEIKSIHFNIGIHAISGGGS
jgi:hypothetical protein